MTSPTFLRHFLVSTAVLFSLFAVLNVSAARSAETSETGGIITHEVEQTPAEVKSTWTQEDFENAIPADTEPSPSQALSIPDFPDASTSAKPGGFYVEDPTQLPKRLQGKVFFRVGNLIYSCSATVISSRFGNAVFTAGHCVYDRESGGFVQNFIFLPGYNARTSLGAYTATTLASTKKWINTGSFTGDIGIATLSGTPVANLGGARGVAFNLNPKNRKFTIYGYPGEPSPPFDGERLWGCRVKVVGRDKNPPRTLAGYPCIMGPGTSGGGWITHGYLNSVSSYYYCNTPNRYCGYLFGPYFGKWARQLYTSPAVGGSIDPIIAIAKHPKRKTSKRRVNFRFIAIASTPMNFQCKFDHRKWQKCRARTSISRLSKGRHTLRLRAWDQTGRPAVNKQRFRFYKR